MGQMESLTIKIIITSESNNYFNHVDFIAIFGK